MLSRTGARLIFADKVRAGHILKIDKKYWRVTANSRSQKGQLAASFNIKTTEIGTGKLKEYSASQGFDFQDVRAERVGMLFSGFDDDDYACFVFPQHSSEAGKEVNIKADSLPEGHQAYLACGMPVDILRIHADEEDEPDVWCEVNMPSSYTYTVEKITMKGLYKMASLVECDGLVSVPDTIQIGEKIKCQLKPDGTARFQNKVI